MSELEHEDVQRLLSVPAAHVPGQVPRRLFLQGALASAGALAVLPSIFDGMAAAATPVAADEGILLVVQLGGGNDGLTMVPPLGDATYAGLRGKLAVTGALPLSSRFGLHPAMPKLKARYDQGKVAVVQGVGQTGDDHSHFSSTATWMAGTAGSSRATGWLGRWLDGVPEASKGLRAVSIGPSIPLHLVGGQAVVTALDTGGELFGSDRSSPAYVAAYDALGALGSGPTGKGAYGDALAVAMADALELAVDLEPMFSPPLGQDSLVSQLTLVARLINANLGIRVLAASHGSYDTHDRQLVEQPALLGELDAAIEAFYAALDPAWARRVTIITFSEFGRRASANASLGTDHGNSSTSLVIGDNVHGGFYGQAPDLADLTSRGDPKVHVDFRSLYASVVAGWLDADPAGILGSSFEDLGLFRGRPGELVSLPITTGRWIPFGSAADLVRQQYRDFLGREGDVGGVSFWASRLEKGTDTTSTVILHFLDSPEFGRTMAPVARLALAALRTPPTFSDLTAWSAAVRGGTPLADVAEQVCTRSAFTSHYGAMSTSTFVDAAYRDVVGRAPSTTSKATWVARIDGGSHSRADLLVALCATPDAERRFQGKVNVLMTYAGLLQRAPDPSGWSYWVRKVDAGTSVGGLVAQFFTSSEYRRRFGWP